MGDPDDATYRKNVRNMSLVLAAIVLTIFVALFVPPLIFPPQEQFLTEASVNSPYGFTLSVELNSTSAAVGEMVNISAAISSTSNQVLNISSSRSWGVNQSNLVTRPCTPGWPLGVGVMRGYYDEDNYSLGTLVPIETPVTSCPLPGNSPGYFLLQSHGSMAIVNIRGSLAEWNLGFSVVFPAGSSGVYTAVVADEWGDLVLTHFRVG